MASGKSYAVYQFFFLVVIQGYHQEKMVVGIDPEDFRMKVIWEGIFSFAPFPNHCICNATSHAEKW